MVHVKKCPCKNGRGKPTTEFYKDGKPQIYCYGWIDNYNDEPLDCCKNCDDWAYGLQCQKDFDKAIEDISKKQVWKMVHETFFF